MVLRSGVLDGAYMALKDPKVVMDEQEPTVPSVDVTRGLSETRGLLAKHGAFAVS